MEANDSGALMIAVSKKTRASRIRLLDGQQPFSGLCCELLAAVEIL